MRRNNFKFPSLCTAAIYTFGRLSSHTHKPAPSKEPYLDIKTCLELERLREVADHLVTEIEAINTHPETLRVAGLARDSFVAYQPISLSPEFKHLQKWVNYAAACQWVPEQDRPFHRGWCQSHSGLHEASVLMLVLLEDDERRMPYDKSAQLHAERSGLFYDGPYPSELLVKQFEQAVLACPGLIDRYSGANRPGPTASVSKTPGYH